MNTFGKYLIIQEIGHGGFATVFRAKDLNLEREIALKILKPLLMSDPIWVRRFRQEAKAIARLEHPHIVTIYEVREHEGRLFIAMQLASEGDLAQRIKSRDRLSWQETVGVITQVARALDFAHQQGVIHRDLKPSNILFDRTAGVLLTDFGFARIVADNSLSMSLGAASGGIVGTPAYIAPEIWDNKPATPQSDVYSLGCILYEMVTGKPLFGGETPLQVMRAHDNGPQFPAQWPDDVPRGLEKVLQRAVTATPEARYASAGEFARALAALPAAAEASMARDRRAAASSSRDANTVSGRKWPLWTGAMLLLLALLAGGWWFVAGRHADKTPAPASTAVAEVPHPTQTATPSPTTTATLSPTVTPSPTRTPTASPTLAPTSTPDDSAWRTLYEQAVKTYNRGGEWEQAVTLFSNAIDLMPDSATDKARAYNYRGWSYHRLGQNDKAIEDFTQAIKLDPDFARAYNNRGVIYNDLQQYDKAIPDFTQAIALKHKPLTWPHANRGYSYYRLGQLPAALADFSRCIELQSNYAECYLQRGHVYKKMGEVEAARSDYEKCVQLAGDNYPGNICAQSMQGLPASPASPPTSTPTPAISSARTIFDGDPRDSAWLCDGGFLSECNFSANPDCGANGRIVYGPYCRKMDYPAIEPGLYRVEIIGSGRVRVGATDFGSTGTMFALGQSEIDLPGQFTFCWPGRAPDGYGFETIVQTIGQPATVQRIKLSYLKSSCD